MEGSLHINPLLVYRDVFQYSGHLGLPGSSTLPSNWAGIDNFTTRSGNHLEPLQAGEVVYVGTPLSSLVSNPDLDSNFAISFAFKCTQDMIFQVRGRRMNANSFVAAQVDVESATLSIVTSNSTLISVGYNWKVGSAYEITLAMYEQDIFVYMNDYPILQTTYNQNPTEDGFSLFMHTYLSNDIPRFYTARVRRTSVYPEPTLEDSTDLIVLDRKKLKSFIEPTEKTWDTFKTAYRLWKHTCRNIENETYWAQKGYPIQEPIAEGWFGPIAP